MRAHTHTHTRARAHTHTHLWSRLLWWNTIWLVILKGGPVFENLEQTWTTLSRYYALSLRTRIRKMKPFTCSYLEGMYTFYICHHCCSHFVTDMRKSQWLLPVMLLCCLNCTQKSYVTDHCVLHWIVIHRYYVTKQNVWLTKGINSAWQISQMKQWRAKPILLFLCTQQTFYSTYQKFTFRGGMHV